MRGRGNARRVIFSGLNVLYDEERYDYPIGGEGRIYVPLDPQIASEVEDQENAEKQPKSYKILY